MGRGNRVQSVQARSQGGMLQLWKGEQHPARFSRGGLLASARSHHEQGPGLVDPCKKYPGWVGARVPREQITVSIVTIVTIVTIITVSIVAIAGGTIAGIAIIVAVKRKSRVKGLSNISGKRSLVNVINNYYSSLDGYFPDFHRRLPSEENNIQGRTM